MAASSDFAVTTRRMITYNAIMSVFRIKLLFLSVFRKYSWGANSGQTSIKCRDLA